VEMAYIYSGEANNHRNSLWRYGEDN